MSWNLLGKDFRTILCYSFLFQVTFYLLDQSEDYSVRHDFRMEYRPDPALEGYHRPRTEKNPGVGIWRFISHEAINDRLRFLIDDAIFIKVEIEPFDLLG